MTRVATLDEVPPGSSKEVVAGGRVIALFNIEGQIHAIDGICAHAGGPVAKGEVSGSIVTCPWHGWQYDVSSGQSCLNATICQETFTVSVEDGCIFVEV